MTTWYCNRCGEKINHKDSNCPECNKIIYWVKDGWIFPSYFPKGIYPMAYEESRVLKEEWNNKIKEIHKQKGFFHYIKYLVFGEDNKDRRRRRATTEEMAEVFRRYGHKCIECNSEYELTVDHKIPLAKGGTWDIDNLQPMCQSCNSSKGVRV